MGTCSRFATRIALRNLDASTSSSHPLEGSVARGPRSFRAIVVNIRYFPSTLFSTRVPTASYARLFADNVQIIPRARSCKFPSIYRVRDAGSRERYRLAQPRNLSFEDQCEIQLSKKKRRKFDFFFLHWNMPLICERNKIGINKWCGVLASFGFNY